MNILYRHCIEGLRTIAKATLLPAFMRLEREQIKQKTSAIDLVTEIDIEVEKQVANLVESLMPGAVIIGEESYLGGMTQADMDMAPWAVTVDPIDGTWNFAHGLPNFAIMLSIYRFGKPAFAVIYYPVMDDYVYCEPGQGVWWQNGRGEGYQLQVQPILNNTLLCSPCLFDGSARHQVTPLLTGFDKVISLACSAFEYRTLLLGHADGYFSQFGVSLWDHCPGKIMLEELGGVVRLLDGTDFGIQSQPQHLLAARNEQCWQQLAGHFSALLSK